MISRGLGIEISVAVALFLVAGASAPALGADAIDAAGAPIPARARAQELLDRGNELFRTDRFAEALVSYRAAHQAFPSPKLFFNIGRCEESLGHGPQAMASFHAFVTEARDADPLVRAEAQRRMVDLARTLATIELSALPPNAALSVDGRSVGLTPLAQPLWLEAGAHRIAIDRPGKPLWVTTLEARAGTATPLVIAEPTTPVSPATTSAATTTTTTMLGPEHEGPTPPAHAAASRSTWWIWAGIGVLLAGAATVVVIKLRNDCGQTTCE